MKPRVTILLLLAIVAPLAALICAWRFAPPILNTDSATGFLAWESMQAGGPWNSRLTPDPADLARDHAEFVTWWSPGQYVFPGLVHALGLTWCHAALLVTFASVLLGVLGVWRLGKRLGLEPDQSALACLLVSATTGALHGFGMFWGGDILMLAAAPFVYLSALRMCDLPPVFGAARFFFACLLALFCKHGAVAVVAGALFFLAAEPLQERGPRFIREGRLWLAGAAALLAFVLSHLLWVRGGPTPGDAGQTVHSTVAGFAFALNGPWLALTGAGSLASWLFQRAGLESTEGWTRFAPWLLLPGTVGAAFVVWLGFRRDGSGVWRLSACAWLAAASLLAFLYVRGASVSLDDRHLRAAAAPLALALATAALPATGTHGRGRFLALAIVLGALLLGVANHLRRVHLLAALPRGAVSGFAQPDMSAEARTAIVEAIPAGATLVVANPSQALEFPGHRKLVSDAFFRDAEDLARWRFGGAPPPALALAVPAAFDASGRGTVFRTTFVEVAAEDWRVVKAADWQLWIASAKPRPPGP